MKNASAMATILATLVASAWSQSATAPTVPSGTKAQYVFRIPVFPGTELFQSSPVLADLNTPFAARLEVYIAKHGKSLSRESVLAFYRDELSNKGWKDGIFKGQKSEPYLSMQAQVSENLQDGSRIQVAGDFYLWVAPHDGMITVYLKQWRVSTSDQATHNLLQGMAERLTEAALKSGYGTQRVASDDRWTSDFENEYLVDRILYCLAPNGAKPSMDAPPGTVTVSLLTYREAGDALAERTLREQKYKSSMRPYGIDVKDKILVTIEGDAPKQKLASLLAATLSR